jgi:prepilin-type N-terminal cleavage/methylation domain-containing protein
MNSKPSSPISARGFSLIELLVAMTVTGLIGGVTLSITLSSRDVIETDQGRTKINQNLRGGADLLAIELRQAGERMPNDAPAVGITNGSSGAPDSLFLRRNLLDEVLPVCNNIMSGSNIDVAFVAKKGGKVPNGCGVVPDLDGNGWPDNLDVWRNYRIANGGTVLAYIYNPTTGLGEFFTYDAEDNSTFHIHKSNGTKWTYTYRVKEASRIYMLDQREFRIQDGVLQCIVNGDTDNALNLVSFIEDFQARAVFRDGTILDEMDSSNDWTDLQSVEITLLGRATLRDRDIDRTLVTRLFPRNVLSY